MFLCTDLCFGFFFVFFRSDSKWNYHWSLVSNGDFKRLTSGTNDEEKNKPKIKFKVVPPPPKPKPEPPPPPPPVKKAPPKPRRPKRKVEVDVFRLCWKDSWMSLKPPQYLYLKAKERKIRIPGFTTIELTNNRKYKPKDCESETEWTSLVDNWSHSWKQVLRLTQTHDFPVKDTIFQTIQTFTDMVWYGKVRKIRQGRCITSSSGPQCVFVAFPSVFRAVRLWSDHSGWIIKPVWNRA